MPWLKITGFKCNLFGYIEIKLIYYTSILYNLFISHLLSNEIHYKRDRCRKSATLQIKLNEMKEQKRCTRRIHTKMYRYRKDSKIWPIWLKYTIIRRILCWVIGAFLNNLTCMTRFRRLSRNHIQSTSLFMNLQGIRKKSPEMQSS